MKTVALLIHASLSPTVPARQQACKESNKDSGLVLCIPSKGKDKHQRNTRCPVQKSGFFNMFFSQATPAS